MYCHGLFKQVKICMDQPQTSRLTEVSADIKAIKNVSVKTFNVKPKSPSAKNKKENKQTKEAKSNQV